jgi:hypothetical protein
MLSDKTALEYEFALILLAQEIPFGLVPKFSAAAQPFLDTPVRDLTEEQAYIVIDDMTEQRRRYFKETYYGDEGKQDIHSTTQC